MDETKTCKTCGLSKEIGEFVVVRNKNRPPYVRSQCVSCYNLRSKSKRESPAAAVWDARRNRKLRTERASNSCTEKFIRADSRKSDKKAGRQNDLTTEAIRELIAQGCSYCGETELRMTLDRKDNGLGHTLDNVVPACIRCNYTRKNMPYEAWLMLAPAMKAARLAGLFGAWTGRVK